MKLSHFITAHFPNSLFLSPLLLVHLGCSEVVGGDKLLLMSWRERSSRVAMACTHAPEEACLIRTNEFWGIWYAGVYVCMYVCMYVCVCVWICMYAHVCQHGDKQKRKREREKEVAEVGGCFLLALYMSLYFRMKLFLTLHYLPTSKTWNNKIKMKQEISQGNTWQRKK